MGFWHYSIVVESVDIQKFKLDANSILINNNNDSNNNDESYIISLFF